MRARSYEAESKSANTWRAYRFDPATGTGFAGKGDVQLVLGLNNAQLQSQAASLTFATESTSVTDTTWTCTKTSNENTQERSRATMNRPGESGVSGC